MNWNELNLIIFPEWIITRSTGGEEFDTSVVRVGKKESRNANASSGFQRIELAGATLHPDELLQWNTFRALVGGAHKSFLIRNIRHCRLDNSLIGVGDGTRKAFQCQLLGTYEDKTYAWPVRYIDHDYPDRLLPDGRIAWPSQRLRVFVNGVEHLTGWTLDRNTGVVTFVAAPAAGALIRVTGYFLTRVRFEADFAPTAIEDSEFYEIPDGVALIEVEK